MYINSLRTLEGEQMTENRNVSKEKKMVILITHGMGSQNRKLKCSKKYKIEFDRTYCKMKKRLDKRFKKIALKEGKREDYYIKRRHIARVVWADVLQEKQEILKNRITKCRYEVNCENKKLKYRTIWRFLRKFLIDFLSDAIAYYKSINSRETYDKIQAKFLEKLQELVNNVDGVVQDSHLCIIAHSMGSVVVDNLIFDLQDDYLANNWGNEIIRPKYDLDKAKTLEFYYTMGNPLALWSSRRDKPDFGDIIKVKRWVNFYSKSDVIASPLGNLNECYRLARCNAEGEKPENHTQEDYNQCKAVTTKLFDKRVRPGGPLTFWNPGSHNKYWTCRKIIKTIVKDITEYIP